MSPETPPGRKRPRIFYGWYIIGLSSVAGVFAGATSAAFFGVFLVPIEEDTGWSRASISGAVSFATFAAGAVSVFFGRLADKYGPRALMTLGALIFGIGYIAMLVASQAWHLYVGYFLARLAGLQFLAGVVPRTAAVNWFRRMRGRALGFQTTSQPLGGAALAALSGALLAGGADWRVVLAGFGVACVVLLAVPLPLFMRRQPEDMGLLPDGDEAPPATPDAPAHAAHQPTGRQWTFKESLRTPAMWLITVGLFTQTLASGGIAFHMPAYYSDLGMAAGVGAAAASAFLLAGSVASTIWGFLAERFDERKLVVFATVTATLLALYGRFITEPVGAIAFAALFGATIRGEGALVMMMLAAYYGRRSFGTISGYANTYALVGLGFGPVLYSALHAVSGNYSLAFSTSTVLLVVATVTFWLARAPREPQTSVNLALEGTDGNRE